MSAPHELNFVDSLRYHADEDEKEADRLIARAEEAEREARTLREHARSRRLAAIEFRAGANIVEEAGLKVEMGRDGNLVVSVERKLEPSDTKPHEPHTHPQQDDGWEHK